MCTLARALGEVGFLDLGQEWLDTPSPLAWTRSARLARLVHYLEDYLAWSLEYVGALLSATS